jgi:integrase
LPAGGAKTFVYRYRPHGGERSINPRMLKLGAHPSLGVDAARAAARAFAGDVARGLDPAAKRAEERRSSRATLGRLLAEGGPYELHLKARGLVNWKMALSSLRRGLKAHSARVVAALSRNHIVTAIGELVRLGKPGAAGDLRRFSRSFLEWAVSEGLAPFNVMAGLRAPMKTRAQRLLEAEQKGKALDDAGIVAVWRAAQMLQDLAARGEAVSGPFGGLVQLALLTGERAVEDRGINGERIHLPRSITKTAADHDVHLTALMRAGIAAQPRGTSPLLFPSRVGGRLTGWGPLVLGLQRASGVDVRLHDLRRTCRTLMSRLGIAEDIAELAIGHQRADLVARYNKDAAWPARVAAFEPISAHVAALLVAGADNVVALGGTAELPVSIRP